MRRFVTRSSSRGFGFLGWLALGVGIGIAGFTLLEPTRGAARRQALRERTASGLRRIGARTRREPLREHDEPRSVSSLQSPDGGSR